MRRVIEVVLRQHDIEVIGATDVLPPLADIVRSARPDVVVVDLVLRGTVGPEGLDYLTELATLAPVVVFSAHDLMRGEALARGAVAFVEKPDFEGLGRAVAGNMTSDPM